ncbi:unnamed protein product [Mytilus coruscus]|uniref:Uncharacterized protein n=1 Tax=Mytilus coruscus TaxID=42192 RepID=A0A6J8BMQ7_MYTCO|nr:unnamed protein product [Mytilus coruscus]
MGKAKLTKPAGNSIPRLELCGAVLATEIGQFVSHQLDLQPNKTRRFHTYVSKRVSLIQQFTSVEQWNYVPSNLNPADAATRKSSVAVLRVINAWIQGPTYILRDNKLLDESKDDFPLIEPEIDKEIRPVQALKSTIAVKKPIHELFTHYSSWNKIINAFTFLRHIAGSYRKEKDSIT